MVSVRCSPLLRHVIGILPFRIEKGIKVDGNWPAEALRLTSFSSNSQLKSKQGETLNFSSSVTHLLNVLGMSRKTNLYEVVFRVVYKWRGLSGKKL